MSNLVLHDKKKVRSCTLKSQGMPEGIPLASSIPLEIVHAMRLEPGDIIKWVVTEAEGIKNDIDKSPKRA
jgi:hypothetical protein